MTRVRDTQSTLAHARRLLLAAAGTVALSTGFAWPQTAPGLRGAVQEAPDVAGTQERTPPAYVPTSPGAVPDAHRLDATGAQAGRDDPGRAIPVASRRIRHDELDGPGGPALGKGRLRQQAGRGPQRDRRRDEPSFRPSAAERSPVLGEHSRVRHGVSFVFRIVP